MIIGVSPRGRTFGRLGAAIATVVLVLLAASPARAGRDPGAQDNAAEAVRGWVQYRPLHATGKCMAVHNNDVRDNSPVHLWDCERDNSAMEWSAVPSSSGWFEIRNFRLDPGMRPMCLDVPPAGQGAQLIVYRCHGGANQRWRAELSSVHGYQILVNGATNTLLLDAAYSGTANGTPLQVWPHVSGPNQSWAYVEQD